MGIEGAASASCNRMLLLEESVYIHEWLLYTCMQKMCYIGEGVHVQGGRLSLMQTKKRLATEA